MLLTEEQLDFIIAKIAKEKLTYQPLAEEMVDHYACLVELQMEKGFSFSEAMHSVFEEEYENDLGEVERATISLLTYNSTTMRKANKLAAVCIVLCLLGFLFNNNSTLPDEKAYEENQAILVKDLTPETILVSHLDPPSRSPLDEALKITSGFGMRFHPILRKKKMHRGIDLSANRGTPVYATSDGIVEKAITHNKYGKMIVLKHDAVYQTLYAQLSIFEVETGTKVKKGALIGRVGSSGLSTAPHLHYEVLKDGKPVNPEKYF